MGESEAKEEEEEEEEKEEKPGASKHSDRKAKQIDRNIFSSRNTQICRASKYCKRVIEDNHLPQGSRLMTGVDAAH